MGEVGHFTLVRVLEVLHETAWNMVRTGATGYHERIVHFLSSRPASRLR
jgi:hypothetical protein